MPVWNVTGKLGGGKTLYAVHTMFSYLEQGRKVATNIDLFPDKVLPAWNETVRLIRLPDVPGRADLTALGMGNESSDETKNGLIVLDETGGFLNARTYQDKKREGLLSFLRHTRKRGWDVILISQSYSMLDKQIREAVVEYLVRVIRFDRYKVPLLSSLGFKINLPRVHSAIEHYGTTPQAVVSQRTFFRGAGLFEAYSTRQSIESFDGEAVPDEIESLGTSGCYSILPPWHTKGRYMKTTDLLFHATKASLLGGLIVGALTCFLYLKSQGYEKHQVLVAKPTEELQGVVFNENGSAVAVRKDGRMQTVLTYSVQGRTVSLDLGDVTGRATLLR
jgi:hypothetical protein